MNIGQKYVRFSTSLGSFHLSLRETKREKDKEGESTWSERKRTRGERQGKRERGREREGGRIISWLVSAFLVTFFNGCENRELEADP